jgi:hypothetical protein
VIAFGGHAPADLAGHVPLLDPGPVASVFALALSMALVWHGRHKTV